jgi:hypothetical protein
MGLHGLEQGYLYNLLYLEQDKAASLQVIYVLSLILPFDAANYAPIQEFPSNFKEPEGSSPCS